MWLDNRNIATVFVDLDVTLFCCFFNIHVYIILTLADEMFYKQNDIEPVPFGCQLQSLPRLRAELETASVWYSFN
jgi:hypothetical protein